MMKKNHLLITLFFIQCIAFSQNLAQDEVLLRIKLTNNNGHPLAEKISLKDEKTKEDFIIETNEKGFGKGVFKENSKLIVNYEGAPNYCIIKLPEQGYVIYDQELTFLGRTYKYQKFPNINNGLLNLTFKDKVGLNVPGEKFIIENESTGEIFEETTNKFGRAEFLLPLGFNYIFHHEHYPSFRKQKIELKELHQGLVINLELIGMTSKEINKINAINNSNGALLDSLYKIDPKLNGITSELIETKTKDYKEKISEDPKFFEKFHLEVLAPLKRIFEKDKDKNPMIVCDVTYSMAPSMEEVAIWFALQNINSNNIIFFNDYRGRAGKPTDKSGVYKIDGELKESTIIESMYACQKLIETNTDHPENDIQALLFAQNVTKEKRSLILIADNNGGLKHKYLMEKIKVPVHVIVCNLQNQKDHTLTLNKIHSDYLTLARKTNGTIHTITEDINNLSSFNEGEEFTILGTDYRIVNGVVLRVK